MGWQRKRKGQLLLIPLFIKLIINQYLHVVRFDRPCRFLFKKKRTRRLENCLLIEASAPGGIYIIHSIHGDWH